MEIGGYAFELDKKFATALAGTGACKMRNGPEGRHVALVGQQGLFEHLGVVRIGRVGWDTRSGPSDGGRNGVARAGRKLRADLEEGGRWGPPGERPRPLRRPVQRSVRPSARGPLHGGLRPRRGAGGPCFRHEFVLTPDSILSTLTRTSGTGRWGVTLRCWRTTKRLETAVQAPQGIASTRFPDRGDEQNCIVLGSDAGLTPEAAIRSTPMATFGQSAIADGPALTVFVYPRGREDPAAQRVRDSLRVTPAGFSSAIGSVGGNLYVGRTAARAASATASI